jgi:MFS family permease
MAVAQSMPTAGEARRTASVSRTIRTAIPARLDRLPWSGFHWRIVVALGTVWILDGLEVTIVGAIAPRLTETGSGIHLNSAQIGIAASVYVAGACIGALVFGQLTDRYGRKRLFMVTLAVYLLATVATAFAFAPWYFFLFRFFTGLGIGGEYSAINSAIDELIPARNRGQVDLSINGSYWAGSACGGLAALVLLDPSIFPKDLGWRLAFGLGAIIGAGIMLVRRRVPESPRWLLIHGREAEAERIVSEIEAEVQADTGVELPEADQTITIRVREAISFRELASAAIKRYPRRAALGLSLFIGQAFLYNAVVFDLGSILHEFFGVGSGSVPFYMTIFALSNFFGPLLLGRLFDTVGRIPMISSTYLGSAAVVTVLGALLLGNSLTKWSFMGLVLGAFFLASAGASSAYLTVSEVFPLETRALAISLFFAVGTATGGIVGPALFGQLIHSGHRDLVAIGFFIGAAAMAAGGLAELFLGVRAEGKSLENIAKPLTAEDVDTLLPLPLIEERPALADAYQERDQAIRYRELAEIERANAAEKRASLYELRRRADEGDPDAASRLLVTEVEAEVSELRALGFDERAAASEERAHAALAPSEAMRQAALERAAAAEERARGYEARAAMLISVDDLEAHSHGALAEAAAERVHEHEQRALSHEARAEAERLSGEASNVAVARAALHESWARVHAARAQTFEARANRDYDAAAVFEREAQGLEPLARAAEERVKAAEHRLRAEQFRAEDAVLSQSAREERIRQRTVRRQRRERDGFRRLRPGPGSSFYSPGMVGTADPASRVLARARHALEHEIEVIRRTLEERGPIDRAALERLVGGRSWGPGRFRRALREAVRDGDASRVSSTTYEAPDGSQETRRQETGPTGSLGAAH